MLSALILAAAITGGVDAPMQKSVMQKDVAQKATQKADVYQKGVGVDVSRRGVFVRVRSERRHVRLLAGRRCRGARCR